MKNLFCASLVLCLVISFSCSPRLGKLTRQTNASAPTPLIIPIFPDLQSSAWFTTYIEAYKQSFSGLLFIKKTGATYRTVCTTQFGMKLFDLEIGEKSRTVHHCIEALNRRLLLNVLEDDMRLLLFAPEPSNKRNIYLSNEYPEQLIIRLTKGTKRYFYITGKQNDTIQQIRQVGLRGLKKKVIFTPAIRMDHFNIPLKLEFEPIQKNGN